MLELLGEADWEGSFMHTGRRQWILGEAHIKSWENCKDELEGLVLQATCSEMVSISEASTPIKQVRKMSYKRCRWMREVSRSDKVRKNKQGPQKFTAACSKEAA